VTAKATPADPVVAASWVLVWRALVGGVSVRDSTTGPVCVDADRATRTGTVSVVEPTVSVMRSAGRLVVDPRLHAGEIARFTSHVVCGPAASDCNIWTGAIGADGYGRNRAELHLIRHSADQN